MQHYTSEEYNNKTNQGMKFEADNRRQFDSKYGNNRVMLFTSFNIPGANFINIQSLGLRLRLKKPRSTGMQRDLQSFLNLINIS